MLSKLWGCICTTTAIAFVGTIAVVFVSSLQSEKPEPKPTLATTPRKLLTAAQVDALAFGVGQDADECEFEIPSGSKPKHSLKGTFVGMGYTDEELKNLDWFGEVKAAAYEVASKGKEGAIAALIDDGKSEAAARLFVAIAEQEYMPKQRAAVREFCS